MSDAIKVEVSATYQRQFNKLKTADLQNDARDCRRDIYSMLTLQRSGADADEMKRITLVRRIKIIQKHSKKKPKRFEATFAPDGRIVWSFDGVTLRLIYIGTHKVLDMD